MKKNANSTFGIIGLGRFGTALAITLAEAGKEVIVVDQNEEKVKAMRQYTEYAFVCDNLSKATLSEVGIQNCDTVIVCIGSRIDTSILTTLNVVSLGVPHVISKATSQDQGAVLEKIGAEVVYPERDMAIRLGKKLLSGNFLDFIFLDLLHVRCFRCLILLLEQACIFRKRNLHTDLACCIRCDIILVKQDHYPVIHQKPLHTAVIRIFAVKHGFHGILVALKKHVRIVFLFQLLTDTIVNAVVICCNILQ